MRRFFAQRKHALLLLLGAILLCVASQICVFTGYTHFVRLSQRTAASIAIHTTPALISTAATRQQPLLNGQGGPYGLPYTAGTSQTTTQSVRSIHIPTFEAGVTYPQWTLTGYSKSDTRPYVLAAQHNGVEQLAIGIEEERLQQFAPDTLWNQLILNVRSVFLGSLTYDMNWTALQKMPPSWMHNSNLTTIGVSAYISLSDTRKRIDPQEMVTLWKNITGSMIDAFATKLGKSVLISEIGYRNSADALYHVWESSSTAPADPTEQAAACNAALANVTHDPHIRGIFFWGWDDVGAFGLRDQPASIVLHRWYSALTS